MAKLNGKTVVITGASSGIGRATARAFAREGAAVVLASRRGEALREVVRECESLGAQAIAVVTDVSDNDQVEALARAALERFGGFDIWVNNASIAAYGELLKIPVNDFRKVIDVNVLGYVYGSRCAMQQFERTRTGVLINIASIIGEVPQAYSAPYSMAKAAVRALSASLREELALTKRKGVAVVSILPPTVDTPFFRHAANYTGRRLMAMPPVYPPELIAKAIISAAKRPKPEVVIGAAGKAFVREHRRHPLAVEAQMALQTDVGQLSRKQAAEISSGNLFMVPDSSDASVAGGWGGAKRLARRSILVTSLLVGAGLLAATQLYRKQWPR